MWEKARLKGDTLPHLTTPEEVMTIIETELHVTQFTSYL
jgi:hypothetical protein